MISLKKYLDDQKSGTAEKGVRSGGTAVDCYRTSLLAMGRSAAQGCPVHGQSLEATLRGLEHRLATDPSESTVRWVGKQAEVQLEEWGARSAEQFKAHSNEVKELLVTLAKSAELIGDRSEGQTKEFRQATTRLESLADLNDLVMMRTMLVQRVNELKESVDRMSRENREMVEGLKAEVSQYEARLREVEKLVMKDEVTGAASRRSVEDRMRRYIEAGQTFCVVVLDLNGFKQINDQFGHPAGDLLLRRFASELQAVTRVGDLVGRWSGDEFVVLLACDAEGARQHTDRIREWVFGRYTLDDNGKLGPLEVAIDAAIGVAEWHAGESQDEVIAAADTAMYEDKKRLAHA